MKTCKYAILAAILALVIPHSMTAYSSAMEDFDALCNLIDETLEMSLSAEKKITYVNDNLQQRINSKDVKEAFISLQYLDPAERYSVFKQAAEATIDKQWECAPMKIFFEPAVNAN